MNAGQWGRGALAALAFALALALPLRPMPGVLVGEAADSGQSAKPASSAARRELPAADVPTPQPGRAPTPTPPVSPEASPASGPPFRLPFAGEPGPSTWLLTQAYGNTIFAYRERMRIYDAGQGLHFGIDLAARCGTPVLAIGDGVVVQVDNIYHGAGPHNVVIDHPSGYASLYGHLLARSHLIEGATVRRGDPVGVSGDPDLTCSSRPHLHLEIRNAPSHRKAFNPMLLIAADWDRIALAGDSPLGFEQDLADPARWITWADQPVVVFGQPLLNDYESAWPPDW